MTATEKKILLILGQRGCGKSTLSEMMTEDCRRLFVYDTLNNCRVRGVIIESYDELVAFWSSILDKNPKAERTFPFRIIYRPVDPQEDFERICDLVYSLGYLTFLVEEVDSFIGSQKDSLPRDFLNIVQRGRHRDIELIGITQRPYAIPPILRSQAKEIYTFRQFEPRDIDFMRAFIGDEADKIRDLADYEYIFWDGKNVDYRFTEPT